MQVFEIELKIYPLFQFGADFQFKSRCHNCWEISYSKFTNKLGENNSKNYIHVIT